MADIAIQFHATPDEITRFVQDSVIRENVHLVILKSHPFSVKEIPFSEIEFAVKDGPTDRLRFLVEPPDLDLKYIREFDEKHVDQLILDVGRLSTAGLSQSWLACRTDNLDALKIWRRIAKNMKNQTKAGVICINRENGASGIEKSFRYTDGAKRLESMGVAMLPPQGPKGPIIRLGEIREG